MIEKKFYTAQCMTYENPSAAHDFSQFVILLRLLATSFFKGVVKSSDK